MVLHTIIRMRSVPFRSNDGNDDASAPPASLPRRLPLVAKIPATTARCAPVLAPSPRSSISVDNAPMHVDVRESATSRRDRQAVSTLQGRPRGVAPRGIASGERAESGAVPSRPQIRFDSLSARDRAVCLRGRERTWMRREGRVYRARSHVDAATNDDSSESSEHALRRVHREGARFRMYIRIDLDLFYENERKANSILST